MTTRKFKASIPLLLRAERKKQAKRKPTLKDLQKKQREQNAYGKLLAKYPPWLANMSKLSREVYFEKHPNSKYHPKRNMSTKVAKPRQQTSIERNNFTNDSIRKASTQELNMHLRRKTTNPATRYVLQKEKQRRAAK